MNETKIINWYWKKGKKFPGIEPKYILNLWRMLFHRAKVLFEAYTYNFILHYLRSHCSFWSNLALFEKFLGSCPFKLDGRVSNLGSGVTSWPQDTHGYPGESGVVLVRAKLGLSVCDTDLWTKEIFSLVGCRNSIQVQALRIAAYYISPIEIGKLWAKITYVKRSIVL